LAYFITMSKKNKETPQEKPLYEWVFHPAKANFLVTALVSVFLFLLLVLVYFLTDKSRFITIVSAIVLIGSMRSFYFPTTFQLFENHIRVIYTISSVEKEWKIYRSVSPEKNGIFLSTFGRKTRLENFRGLFLKYGYANRDKILNIVNDRVMVNKDERENVSSSSGRGTE